MKTLESIAEPTTMSSEAGKKFARKQRQSAKIQRIAVWALALVWIVPLIYIVWASFRHGPDALKLNPFSGWTFSNYADVWQSAPFTRFYINTTLLVLGLTLSQLFLGVLAAYAFARFRFPFQGVMFAFVLLQLMIFPEILLVENFQIVSKLGLSDTLVGIGLPYAASAFVIFMLRQAFLSVPNELVEAAEMEGTGRLGVLWKVYVPVARPSIIAFGLITVSFHWNNFLWPLIITKSQDSRPITVGVYRFLSPELGIDFESLTAATVLSVAPILILFIIAQRALIQNFLSSGIK